MEKVLIVAAGMLALVVGETMIESLLRRILPASWIKPIGWAVALSIVLVAGNFIGWLDVPSSAREIKSHVANIERNMVTREDLNDLATKKDFEYATGMRVEKVSPDKPFSVTSTYPRRITVEGPEKTVVKETEFFIDQKPTFEPAPLPTGGTLLGTIVLGHPTVDLQRNVTVAITLNRSDLEVLQPDLKNLSIYHWTGAEWEFLQDTRTLSWQNIVEFDTSQVGYYALVAK